MPSEDALRARLAAAGTLCEHEPLARHTTMRLGGPARWFVSVADAGALGRLLSWLETERVPWAILGGGSNTVAPDEGYPGVVVRPAAASFAIDAAGEAVAESGAVTALFARKVTEAGWAGWEWGVGLPGTVGGAVVGNAGCFGGETGDGLAWVEAWRAETGAVERLPYAECGFAYRESRFKRERCVVLRAAWRLRRASDPVAARARLAAVLAERKTHQPLGASSAGCLFKNVAVDAAVSARLEALLGPLPPGVAATGRIPAGWIIERAGMKGFACGGMRVSERHANFAVQAEAATAADLRALREAVVRRVRELAGVGLETEVRFLGAE